MSTILIVLLIYLLNENKGGLDDKDIYGTNDN